MKLTKEAFGVALLAEVPEISSMIAEHLEDFDGDVLIHLVLPDVLKFAVERFNAGDRDLSDRVLKLVDRALRDGDDALQNGVAVSFVEGIGAWDRETPEFIASWPTGLLIEKARQDAWRQ